MSKRLTGKEANLVGYWPLNEVKQEGSTVGVLDLTNNSLGTVTQAKLVEDSTFPVPWVVGVRSALSETRYVASLYGAESADSCF